MLPQVKLIMIYITVDRLTSGKRVLFLNLINKHNSSLLSVKQRQLHILIFFLTIAHYMKPYLQKYLGTFPGAKLNFKDHFETRFNKVSKTAKLLQKL